MLTKSLIRRAVLATMAGGILLSPLSFCTPMIWNRIMTKSK